MFVSQGVLVLNRAMSPVSQFAMCSATQVPPTSITTAISTTTATYAPVISTTSLLFIVSVLQFRRNKPMIAVERGGTRRNTSHVLHLESLSIFLIPVEQGDAPLSLSPV
jgi:hypothetical protein